MRNVMVTSIERFVSFAFLAFGIAAIVLAAGALFLILGDILGHA